jgi:hypothetical protein
MSNRTLAWLGIVPVTLPAVFVTASMVAVVAHQVRMSSPVSTLIYRNSAEAAAAGDPARVLRFLRMGDDPTRIRAVRPELISGQVLRVTTLEAAMWSRQVDMIRVLDREGAIVDPDQRRELACLASDLDLPDVKSYLAPEEPCVPGAIMKRIIARSSSQPTHE